MIETVLPFCSRLFAFPKKIDSQCLKVICIIKVGGGCAARTELGVQALLLAERENEDGKENRFGGSSDRKLREAGGGQP